MTAKSKLFCFVIRSIFTKIPGRENVDHSVTVILTLLIVWYVWTLNSNLTLLGLLQLTLPPTLPKKLSLCG